MIYRVLAPTTQENTMYMHYKNQAVKLIIDVHFKNETCNINSAGEDPKSGS